MLRAPPPARQEAEALGVCPTPVAQQTRRGPDASPSASPAKPVAPHLPSRGEQAKWAHGRKTLPAQAFGQSFNPEALYTFPHAVFDTASEGDGARTDISIWQMKSRPVLTTRHVFSLLR